jgi:1-aminocyclopropane-1-carboxylate deaminase/D-cysteine desulfhydrase-like pyridoxal-dependent ACC family enzyme
MLAVKPRRVKKFRGGKWEKLKMRGKFAPISQLRLDRSAVIRAAGGAGVAGLMVGLEIVSRKRRVVAIAGAAPLDEDRAAARQEIEQRTAAEREKQREE